MINLTYTLTFIFSDGTQLKFEQITSVKNLNGGFALSVANENIASTSFPSKGSYYLFSKENCYTVDCDNVRAIMVVKEN